MSHVSEMESYHFASDSVAEIKLAREIIDKVVQYKQAATRKDLLSARWSRQEAGEKKDAIWNDLSAAEHRCSTIINELMDMAEAYQESQVEIENL